jgi:hypothetical protein
MSPEFKQSFNKGAGYTAGIMTALIGLSLLACALELVPRRIYAGRG